MKKRIGDIISISSGGTPKRDNPLFYQNGTIPWVKTGDLKGKYSNYPTEFITEDALKNSSAKIFPKGTVLLAMYGATIGECSILNFEAATNQACAALLPNEIIDENYLYYFLSSYKPELIKLGVGGAQPNISAGIIKDIQIPLPPLPEQKRIADLLDTADCLCQKDKALLEKYDQLAQSLFLEMFGDPVKNEKGWEVKNVEDLASKEKHSIKAGPFGSSLKKEFYVHSGYKIYGQEQVIKDDLNFGNYYIDEKKYKELENCKIQRGDILISLVGTYGKISVVPEKFEPGIINPRLMKITPDQSLVRPDFLKTLLQSKTSENQMKSQSRGGTMDIVNVGIMRKIKLPIPPISLQNQFAEQVQLIEKQKELAKENLEKSEKLFNGLMLNCFK